MIHLETFDGVYPLLALRRSPPRLVYDRFEDARVDEVGHVDVQVTAKELRERGVGAAASLRDLPHHSKVPRRF